MANHLVKKSNLKIEDAEEIIDNAMSAYMDGHNYSYSVMTMVSSKIAGVLDKMRIPSFIDREIRSNYHKIIRRKKYITYKDIVPSYKHDFDEIHIHVLPSFQDTSNDMYK